jgi:hypothetical protein
LARAWQAADLDRDTDAEEARVTARAEGEGGIAYTIATLVNDGAQYEAMRATFSAFGFGGPDCEYLSIDNTGATQTEAHAGLNRLLDRARGRFVILCHQDVRLIGDGRQKLDTLLADLERRDPGWALAGNAGGIAPGRLALRITDPHGSDRRIGEFPQRVVTLDENFIVMKRSARLGFSRDLAGFHLYGADLCLVADILGYSSHVIDFHLHHLSPGTKSADFHAAEAAFRAKWSRALRSRWLQTTCTLVPISGDRVEQLIGGMAGGAVASLARRLPAARGWKKRSAQ